MLTSISSWATAVLSQYGAWGTIMELLRKIPHLSPAQSRALGQFFLDLGRGFLSRADRAEDEAAERQQLRERIQRWRGIWSDVAARVSAGKSFERAIAETAEDLEVPAKAVLEAWRLADNQRGAHKRRLRDLDIARRAARGESRPHRSRARRGRPIRSAVASAAIAPR
jgi:hypothetical protein